MSKRLTTLIAALSLAAGLVAVPVTTLAQKPAEAGASAVASPAAPAAPAPTSTGIVSKETVDNPYGLAALWAQGDFVSRGTLIILVIMSMGSWYILITKLYESLKMSAEARAGGRKFFKSASLAEGVQTLKKGSAFRYIAETGVEAGEVQKLATEVRGFEIARDFKSEEMKLVRLILRPTPLGDLEEPGDGTR